MQVYPFTIYEYSRMTYFTIDYYLLLFILQDLEWLISYLCDFGYHSIINLSIAFGVSDGSVFSFLKDDFFAYTSSKWKFVLLNKFWTINVSKHSQKSNYNLMNGYLHSLDVECRRIICTYLIFLNMIHLSRRWINNNRQICTKRTLLHRCECIQQVQMPGQQSILIFIVEQFAVHGYQLKENIHFPVQMYISTLKLLRLLRQLQTTSPIWVKTKIKWKETKGIWRNEWGQPKLLQMVLWFGIHIMFWIMSHIFFKQVIITVVLSAKK